MSFKLNRYTGLFISGGQPSMVLTRPWRDIPLRDLAENGFPGRFAKAVLLEPHILGFIPLTLFNSFHRFILSGRW